LPLNLGSDSFINNKYEHYAWMREEAPVCPGKISLFRLKLLSRYEDCAQLAKDERFRRNRTRAVGGSRFPIPLPKSVQAVAYSMIVEDDPEHRRLRGWHRYKAQPIRLF
jgi:cytochrome P450